MGRMRRFGVALVLCAMLGGARGQESPISEGYANPEARRSFRVMSSDGKPLPGALVAFVPAVYNVPPRTRADAEGVATAEMRVEWPMRFEMAGYMPRTFSSVFAIPDEGVFLAPAGTIAGHVTNASGEPLFGVDVRIEDEGSGFIATTRSDDQGHFRFDRSVLAPAVTLTIPDDHYVTVRRRVIAGTEDVAIVLRPGARVHGVVRRHDGSLAEDAVVEGFVCVKGRFDAAGLSPGRHRFRARLAGATRFLSREVTLDGGEAMELVLDAPNEERELPDVERVRILGAAGGPVAARRVWIEGEEGCTDAEGFVTVPRGLRWTDLLRVRVESLAGSPGLDTLLGRTHVSARRFDRQLPDAGAVETTTARLPDLCLFAIRLHVEATVTLIEPDGRRVAMDRRNDLAMLSAEAGCEYAIEVQRPGLPRCVLARWTPTFWGVPFLLPPTTDPVREIRGRLLIDGDEPLCYTDVHCTCVDAYGWRTEATTRTDRIGQFVLSNLPPGHLTLGVSHGGTRLARFELAYTPHRNLGDFAVQRPRRFRGRIADACARALVTVMPSGDVATTDAQGRFELDVPSSAPFWLLAECDGFAATHLDPAAAELRLAPATTACILIEPRGLGAVQVDVAPPGTDRWRRIIDDPTGETGEHLIEDLPPGPLRFRLTRGDLVLEKTAEEAVTFDLWK